MTVDTLYTIAHQYQPSYDNGPSRHDYHELAYVIRGNGTLLIDRQEHALVPNLVAVVPRNCRHREIAGPGGRPSSLPGS